MRALVRTANPRRRAILAAAGVMLAACLVPASSTPQTPAAKGNDLDAFMARVLERRDENWRKLHDYILSETETFSIASSGRLPAWSKEADDLPLNGFRREYMWYVRDGYLIRSPLRYDGVALSEKERKAYEDNWMKQEKDREKNAQKRQRSRSGRPKAERRRRRGPRRRRSRTSSTSAASRGSSPRRTSSGSSSSRDTTTWRGARRSKDGRC